MISVLVVAVAFLWLCILRVNGRVLELRRQVKRLEARVSALDDPLRPCTPAVDIWTGKRLPKDDTH